MKGTFAIYSVVLTTEFVTIQSRAALSFGDHYSETRFAARGTLGTTPKLNFLPVGDELHPSLCVIRGPCAPWRTEPVPVTLTCQPGGSRGSSVCRTRGSRSLAKGSWGRGTRCGRICGSDNRCVCGHSRRGREAQRQARWLRLVRQKTRASRGPCLHTRDTPRRVAGGLARRPTRARIHGIGRRPSCGRSCTRRAAGHREQPAPVRVQTPQATWHVQTWALLIKNERVARANSLFCNVLPPSRAALLP